MSDQSSGSGPKPGETDVSRQEKTVSGRVDDAEAAPKAGVEREDAQPSEELAPLGTDTAPEAIGRRDGMWSARHR